VASKREDAKAAAGNREDASPAGVQRVGMQSGDARQADNIRREGVAPREDAVLEAAWPVDVAPRGGAAWLVDAALVAALLAAAAPREDVAPREARERQSVAWLGAYLAFGPVWPEAR